MSIYDKISKMLGHESEAEKLYKVLTPMNTRSVLMSILTLMRGWL